MRKNNERDCVSAQSLLLLGMADGETMFDHVVKIGFGMVNLNRTFCHVAKFGFGMVERRSFFYHVSKIGFQHGYS